MSISFNERTEIKIYARFNLNERKYILGKNVIINIHIIYIVYCTLISILNIIFNIHRKTNLSVYIILIACQYTSDIDNIPFVFTFKNHPL